MAMKQRSLVPIGSFLKSYFEKKGWSSYLQEYRIWTHWDHLVGPQLSKRCQPLLLRNRILTVSVSSSSWLTQLQFIKSNLIAKIRQSLQIPLHDIYFQIIQNLPKQNKDLPKPKITQASLPKTDNTFMAHVQDSELRQIIESIFKKHYQQDEK